VQLLPRITVEVPVLSIGRGPSDYEHLASNVDALRRPQGLHLTLLHVGVLEEFSQDITDWTKGLTGLEAATRRTVAWLQGLPVLGSFSGRAERLIVLGGGNVSGLEVEVPSHVRDYQVSLVKALRELLEELLVDNVDDFILSSRALGFRYPHWIPHVAVGRPKTRGGASWEIEPLTVEFGESRIRNRRFLPSFDADQGT
jgi:2'-5' RNA ligase